MKKFKQIIATFAIFCLMFTNLPMLTGELTSHALPKSPTLNLSINGANKPYLTWNRVKTPYNGYAVFKNGKVYKRFNTKTFSFTDTAVGIGQTNTYQIKTYQTRKKVTKYYQYYNKKTKKWQNKYIKKAKRRTCKKTTYFYSYKTASTIKSITTNRLNDSISVSSGGKEIVSGTMTVGQKASFTLSTKSGRTPTINVGNPSVCRVANNTVYGLNPGQTTVNFYLPVAGTWNGATKTISITVKAAPTPSCTHEWNEGVITTPPTATSTGVKTYTCTKCGAKKTETISKSNPYDLPYESWLGCADDGFAIGDVIEVTDYLGKKHTLEKIRIRCWRDQATNSTYDITKAEQFVKINSNIDSNWTASGGVPMLTYHGATFNLDKIRNPRCEPTQIDTYYFSMYNCDVSKLTIECDANVVWRQTFDENKKPCTMPYLYKNGHYLAQPYWDSGEIYKIEKINNIVSTCTIPIITRGTLSGYGLGVFTDTINYTIKYDGKVIETFSYNTAKNSTFPNWEPTIDGMSPDRQAAYDIAKTAIASNGGKKDFDTDMRAIMRYINNNYSPHQAIYAGNDYVFDMSCIGGVLVLETYAIKEYGEYGFITNEGGGAEHQTLRIDSNLNLGPYSAGRSY